MRGENIAASTAESITVTCPVCGGTVAFRPIVTGVTIRSAADEREPHLIVGLQPGNVVKHTCAGGDERNG